jgi:hypothetical protein
VKNTHYIDFMRSLHGAQRPLAPFVLRVFFFAHPINETIKTSAPAPNRVAPHANQRNGVLAPWRKLSIVVPSPPLHSCERPSRLRAIDTSKKENTP